MGGRCQRFGREWKTKAGDLDPVTIPANDNIQPGNTLTDILAPWHCHTPRVCGHTHSAAAAVTVWTPRGQLAAG